MRVLGDEDTSKHVFLKEKGPGQQAQYIIENLHGGQFKINVALEYL